MKMNEPIPQTRITAEPLISNPERPFARLRGSYSSNQPLVALAPALRPIDDGGDPFPDDPIDPPPPPPAVSAPDLGLQLSTCLPADLNAQLISAVKEAIDPNADVRSACVNGSQHVGIWLRPAINTADSQARDRGLNGLSIIGPGETLAFFVNSALIRRQALDGWNKQAKRVDGNGNADPNGPVHLTGFSVGFQSPNRIVTSITGFDERPWPDVDFTLIATDTFSVSGGQVHVDSTRKLDVDTSWLIFLTGLFLLVMPVLFTLFFGFVFGSMLAPKPAVDPRLPVGVINQDGGSLAAYLEKLLADSEVIRPVALAADQAAQANQMVDKADLAAVVTIPAGYTTKLLADQSVKL